MSVKHLLTNTLGSVSIFNVIQPFTHIQQPRINNQITAPELRVIDETGKNLGVISREEALKLVRPEAKMDLIEIVSTAKPPIARVMSFDKYRYEREKAIKKERLAQKVGSVKRVQITVRAAENDLMIKVKKLEEFLSEGHPVEVYLRLRGREKGNPARAEEKLREFLKLVTMEYKTVTPPKFGGQGFLMQITKK
jgi:translation initiation factor IF-3